MARQPGAAQGLVHRLPGEHGAFLRGLQISEDSWILLGQCQQVGIGLALGAALGPTAV